MRSTPSSIRCARLYCRAERRRLPPCIRRARSAGARSEPWWRLLLSRVRKSARRRSPMSIVSPTICSSPRARPTMSAGRTCCGRPAPTKAKVWIRRKTMSDSQGLETAIGVISGTSMDGIDVALIKSDGETQLKTGPSATFPYPQAVAQRLRAVVADLSEAQAPQLELERLVTDAHVAAVEAFLRRFSLPRARIALVGLHGQTILHRPRDGQTRQLCDGARAATALKIDVVSDFRSADVAAGGEGAPLAPVYHAAMAAGLERPLMILNWGGVGNVTYLGPQGEIIAFDTGPANALIDDFLILRRGLAFDENGALGATG